MDKRHLKALPRTSEDRRRAAKLHTVMHGGAAQHAQTGEPFWALLDSIWPFTCDPVPARPTVDALSAKWGKLNYVNPPFEDGVAFLAKAAAEASKGRGSVVLLPHRTNKAVRHGIYGGPQTSRIIWMEGRLKFRGYDTPIGGAALILGVIGKAPFRASSGPIRRARLRDGPPVWTVPPATIDAASPENKARYAAGDRRNAIPGNTLQWGTWLGWLRRAIPDVAHVAGGHTFWSSAFMRAATKALGLRFSAQDVNKVLRTCRKPVLVVLPRKSGRPEWLAIKPVVEARLRSGVATAVLWRLDLATRAAHELIRLSKGGILLCIHRIEGLMWPIAVFLIGKRDAFGRCDPSAAKRAPPVSILDVRDIEADAALRGHRPLERVRLGRSDRKSLRGGRASGEADRAARRAHQRKQNVAAVRKNA